MKFMLSFNKGVPIALALDRHDNCMHTIFVTPDETIPDIEADNPLELLNKSDITSVVKALRLGRVEQLHLEKAVRTQNLKGLDPNSPLHRAFTLLVEKANNKLKREISFNDGTVESIIPIIGNKVFDRSLMFIGPSGAGKSYLAKKIMQFDRKRRPVILFSKVLQDPSLKDLGDRLTQIPILTDDDLLSLPTDSDLEGKLVFYDDIDSFPPDMAEHMRQVRNAQLESGRHKNITVLSTSHILSNYNKTRTTLNEAEWVFVYPPSNRRSADQFLKDRMGMIKADRDHLINKSNESGRYLGVRLSCPNLILHQKGVLLL